MSNRKYLTIDEMIAVKCNPEEQETSISMMRNDSKVLIFTSDNTFITKIKRIIVKCPDNFRCYVSGFDRNDNPVGYFIEGPKKILSIRTGKSKKSLSPEERAERAERAAHMRKSKAEKQRV